MSVLHLKITTPEGIIYEDEADSITLPAEAGEITILPHHIPLASLLKPGEIIIRKGGAENYLSVSTGLIEVSKNNVTILADTAEKVESLVEEEILKAKERAEQIVQEKRRTSDIAFAEAASGLERELARLKVYKRRRQPRGRLNTE